jgi:putative FmdB family regulatory protein
MPTYEYHCEHCNKSIRIIHEMNEQPKPVCEDCSTPLNRVFKIGAVQFKGGGWGRN